MLRSFGYLVIAVKPKVKCDLYYVKHGLMFACDVCLFALTWVSDFSVITLDVRVFHFASSATIRQFSDVQLKWATKTSKNIVRSMAGIFYCCFNLRGTGKEYGRKDEKRQRCDRNKGKEEKLYIG
jgi:hypothetical protein